MSCRRWQVTCVHWEVACCLPVPDTQSVLGRPMIWKTPPRGGKPTASGKDLQPQPGGEGGRVRCLSRLPCCSLPAQTGPLCSCWLDLPICHWHCFFPSFWVHRSLQVFSRWAFFTLAPCLAVFFQTKMNIYVAGISVHLVLFYESVFYCNFHLPPFWLFLFQMSGYFVLHQEASVTFRSAGLITN